MHGSFVVRCRGIILHEGELLVVEHVGKEGFITLPGGHLEWGEDIKIGLIREIEEELGIRPVLGSLLYVHNFTQENGKHTIEFIFAVENGVDYRTLVGGASHAHELASVAWVTPEDTRTFRPVGLWEDFVAGRLGDGGLRFLPV